jgi:PPOX class probable F420-dependent enzyme
MSAIPASHHELLAGLHTAVITCVSPTGRLQSTAVWFIHDDGVILVSTTTRTKKYRNLVADPRITFFLLNPANPWNYVEVRGTATVEPDPIKALMHRIGEKHGIDVSGFDRPGDERVIVSIRPETVNVR